MNTNPRSVSSVVNSPMEHARMVAKRSATKISLKHMNTELESWERLAQDIIAWRSAVKQGAAASLNRRNRNVQFLSGCK